MKLFQLYAYFGLQFLRGLFFKAFVALTVILCIYLFFAERLPIAKAVATMCSMLVLAYYVVATAGSIIEKTERYSIELILSKPFTRRDIILADFLSTVTITSLMTLLLLMMITLVYGIRAHEWTMMFCELFVALSINFIAIYAFVILSGIILKNAAIVTVIWIGYVYVVALLLEARSEFIYARFSAHVLVRASFDGLYYFLPQVHAVSINVISFLSKTTGSLQPILFTLLGGMVALVSSIFFFNRQEMD